MIEQIISNFKIVGEFIGIKPFGNVQKPIIDAAGYEAGVHIINSNYIEVQNLEIISDGGDAFAIDGRKKRYGVLVEGINNETYRHFGKKQSIGKYNDYFY